MKKIEPINIMKKLLLILLCVPLIGLGQTKNTEKKEKTPMEQKAFDECIITLNEISMQKKEHFDVRAGIEELFIKELEKLCSCAVEKKGIYWGEDLSIIGMSKLCGSKELQRKAEVFERKMTGN